MFIEGEYVGDLSQLTFTKTWLESCRQYLWVCHRDAAGKLHRYYSGVQSWLRQILNVIEAPEILGVQQ